MTKETSLLAQARTLAAQHASWLAFSNALFDPTTGLLSRACPNSADRDAFVKTDEYRRIRDLLEEKMMRRDEDWPYR